MIIMTNSNGIGIWLTCSQSDCSQLFTIVPRVHWSQFQKVKMKRGAAEKNVSGWIIFNKTIIYIKGILWEIYECVSEVLSHLGRMFGVKFRARWAQKVTKKWKPCLTNFSPGVLRCSAGGFKNSTPGSGHLATTCTSLLCHRHNKCLHFHNDCHVFWKLWSAQDCLHPPW